MKNNMEYNEKRKAFYSQYPHFFSDFDFENPPLEYALYQVLEMPISLIRELKYATEILWRIHVKMYRMVKELEQNDLLRLGFHEEILSYIHLNYLNQPSILSRFDFVCTDDGKIKMLELNADTPFLLTETFEMNEALCKEFGKENPNNTRPLTRSLLNALEKSLEYIQKDKQQNPKVVITGMQEDEDIEEYCNVHLIKKMIPFEIEYVPISELIIFPESTKEYERGLYTGSLEKIDVLYRPAHPIEFLIHDVAPDGDRIGLHLLDLVRDRKLAIINSPAAYILQSKVLMMLIWGCRNVSKMFTEEERNAIEKYMLPTYLTKNAFLKDEIPFVKKPVFSREGNTIEIYDANGRALNASGYRHYEENVYIYQEYIELPEVDILLKDGQHRKKWLIGSFVADNEACGLSCRVGNQITEWDSHWMAVTGKE